jgi:hypothetical protein
MTGGPAIAFDGLPRRRPPLFGYSLEIVLLCGHVDKSLKSDLWMNKRLPIDLFQD